MKKHLITRSLILVPAAVLMLQCNKMESGTAPDAQKLSLSDSVTAKPKLEHNDVDGTAEKIAHYIADDYLTPNDLKVIPMSDRKFRYQQMDLNGDGKMEVFVGFYTPYFCGTGGCTVLLLDDHLKPIMKFTVTTTPLYADQVKGNQWKTLYVQDGKVWKELTYENGKYPANPTVLPASAKEPSEQAQGILETGKEEHTF